MGIRSWHRGVGLLAAVLLISVGTTGLLLQFQQFFGEAEAEKEKLASVPSTFSVASPLRDFQLKLERAQEAAKAKIGDATLDNVELQLRGDHARFIFHTSGVSNQKVVVNADTGIVERLAPDERESFLQRLHTGEVFGDGGIVLGMIWGMALLFLVISGLLLYWKMYRARVPVRGWRKVFW